MMEQRLSKKIEVYDLETLKEGFCYCGYDITTKQFSDFIVHKDYNQLEQLIYHLKSLAGGISFNGLGFDYPILHMILTSYQDWLDFSNQEIVDIIYRKAQSIIEEQNKQSFSFQKFNGIKDKDIIFPQLDLYKLWHYDNSARRTSLKALEVSMNYYNVLDMPISHDKENLSFEEMKTVVNYCHNDVLATYEFYLKSLELGKIDLRKKIQTKFGLNCISWNNGKIGENLILKLYCDKTGLNPWDVRKLRTHRESINLRDCIPKGISFKSKEFNKLLEFLSNKVITETKGSVEYTVIYKDHKYDFGTGGEHGIHKFGIYESNDKYIIKSADVASLHPNLPLVFDFYPEHLGPVFLEVYGDNIVKVRLAEKAKPKKEQDKAIVDGYKEAANIPYGKSNEKHSFLYDPLYTMKTTIASQLVLSMLCERLSDIPDSQMLMSNTDGCEIRIPRIYESLYKQICDKWQEDTKLVLEFADYQKMWIRDINNYGCITIDSKIKNKGTFEVDKVVGGEPAYHKDNSFRIIPLALQEYYTKNIPIETTIKNHKNIYDFCGRQKFKSDSIGETRFLTTDSNNLPVISTNKQQKTTRYYISNKGVDFFKIYPEKKKEEVIHYGYKVVIFNQFKEEKDYFINYSFYEKECRKIIEVVENKQLELF